MPVGTEVADNPTAAAGAERRLAAGPTAPSETYGERCLKIPLLAPFFSSLPCELGERPSE